MIYLALPLQIRAVSPYISVKRYRDKKFIEDIQTIKALTINPFLVSLNRTSQSFGLTNLTITLLSCPLLFLRVGVCGNPQYPLDLSPLQSLYKYLSVCSQDCYQKCCLLCLIFPGCFSSYIVPPSLDFFQNYLFFQLAIKIFYHCYMTLEFLILRHNLAHAFCKYFNFFAEFMQMSIDDNFSFKM